jgi:hypothetical protein
LSLFEQQSEHPLEQQKLNHPHPRLLNESSTEVLMAIITELPKCINVHEASSSISSSVTVTTTTTIHEGASLSKHLNHHRNKPSFALTFPF